MSNKRDAAGPDSWKNSPMPEQVASFPFRHLYSAQEMRSIRLGLVPEEMEDKWFLFMAADTLFAHRSWTGHCVYRVHFTAKGAGYAASEAAVNRDPGQYRSSGDDYDAVLLGFLIDNLLLGKNTPFPVPSHLPKSVHTGVYQHHVAGTGYAEASVGEQGEPAV